MASGAEAAALMDVDSNREEISVKGEWSANVTLPLSLISKEGWGQVLFASQVAAALAFKRNGNVLIKNCQKASSGKLRVDCEPLAGQGFFHGIKWSIREVAIQRNRPACSVGGEPLPNPLQQSVYYCCQVS